MAVTDTSIPPSALADDGPPIRLIGGPTASGKSAVALDLARRTGGVIVNADALQLYQDLRLLTARPSVEDEAAAPHRLYGVADAADGWSVGRWLAAAEAIIAELREAGRTAIFTGGTGLYFRALTHGLADVPAIPAEVRAETAERFARGGEAAFRDSLHRLDPQAEARIFPGDRQRLLRAMDVAMATGRALSDWQAQTRPVLAPGAYAAVVIEPPRAELYSRCDLRLARMVQEGALAEVEALMQRRLDPLLPAMKAVGVRELAAVVSGQAALEEAVVLAQQETRRYAKRQMTWFRRQTPDWPRLDPTKL